MKEARPVNIRSLLLSALILSSSAFQVHAYYHPDEGRWLSRDPVGEVGFDAIAGRRTSSRWKTDPNIYEFAGNNAIGHVDPFGDAYGNPVPPVVISPPPPSIPVQGTCGPDVTAAVNATLADIAQVYGGWNIGRRCRACFTLYTDISFGWDIIPLSRLGYHDTSGWPVTGTGDGLYTVQFNGKCYHASAVNYAMWGKANNLCRGTFPVNTGPVPGVQPWTLPCAMGAVTGVKLFHGFAQIVEAQAFTVYGYSGFLLPVPPLPWIGPPGALTLNPNLVGPSQPYQWRWRPYQNPNVL